jgi:LacI family transcriptional regulator
LTLLCVRAIVDETVHREVVAVVDPAPGKPLTGIKEVARIAGVSLGTVSNVLNRPEKVAPATRMRVEAVIDRLGFVPNSTAADLRRGHGRLIGLLVPDITNPFFAEVARGAVDVAYAAGYVVVLCNSDNDAVRESRYLEVLEEQRAVGVLLNPVGRVPARLERLRARGGRVVFVDRAVPAQDYCSASVDDVHGGQLAIEHLLACGASRPVLVNGPSSLRQCADRRRGARRAIRAAGLRESVLTEVVADPMSIAGGVDATTRALAARPDLDALFCANDLLAIGAIRVLQSARAVPREVGVIGYDDIAIAADATVPLTSVAQPKYELGRAAGELLLREIGDGEGHSHERILLQPEVTVRASTRAAAMAGR